MKDLAHVFSDELIESSSSVNHCSEFSSFILGEGVSYRVSHLAKDPLESLPQFPYGSPAELTR